MQDKQSLLTIGQIAKLVGITRRIIINYEDHGLIHADTRGEFETGYRYYSMDTLVRIRTIRSLQNIGLSLDEIKAYLDGSSDLSPVLKRMEQLRKELDDNIELLRERMRQSERSKCHITRLPAYTAYYEKHEDTSLQSRVDNLRQVAYTAVSTYGTDISKRMYFMEVSAKHPEQMTYYASVPEGSTGKNIAVLPQTRALVKYHYGNYTHLPQVRQELLAYAREKQIKLSGTFRSIFLEGPPQHKNPENFITIVAALIDE